MSEYKVALLTNVNFKYKLSKTRDWKENNGVNSSVFCVVIPKHCVFGGGGEIRVKAICSCTCFNNEQ